MHPERYHGALPVSQLHRKLLIKFCNTIESDFYDIFNLVVNLSVASDTGTRISGLIYSVLIKNNIP